MLLGYARVSKSDDSQDTAAQVSALKSAGCKRVFEDKASGGRWDRPELHRLLDQLRAGDTLVVWKLDRLSRSLKDLLHILEKVEAVGARFRSLSGRQEIGDSRRWPPSTSPVPIFTASGTTRSNQATLQRQRLIPDNPLRKRSTLPARLGAC